MFKHLTPFVQTLVVRATGTIFIAIGFIFGCWTAMIPAIKVRFELDEAQLGLLLLFLPAGVVVMNPLSIPLIRRLGSSQMSRLFLVLTALLFIFPPLMPTIELVAAGLFLAGMAFSATNIAMNTCAANLEQDRNINIIASCHGLWSLGAMFGAIIASMLSGFGIAPFLTMIFLFGIVTLLAIGLKRPLVDLPADQQESSTEKKSKGFVMPNRALWLIITISICVYLMEGTMADWSAVYMREVLERPETQVGWGFAVYAFFMASGRLLGDQLIARFTSKIALQVGGVIAAIGLGLLILQPALLLILVGFALAGIGVSLGAPILYAASAKAPGLPPGAGLATMNTFAMGAFLAGPAFIGFIAKWYTLPFAFGIIAIGALLWAFQARWMKDV